LKGGIGDSTSADRYKSEVNSKGGVVGESTSTDRTESGVSSEGREGGRRLNFRRPGPNSKRNAKGQPTVCQPQPTKPEQKKLGKGNLYDKTNLTKWNNLVDLKENNQKRK